jgi:hypothetical protein
MLAHHSWDQWQELLVLGAAVLFGLVFRWELDYENAFTIMGSTIIASAFLTAFISIEGHRGLFHGEDLIVDKETGKIVEIVDVEAVLDQKVD